MRYDERTWAGVGFFVGAAQFLTLMMVAEALAPQGYSLSKNPISDLGVGVTAGLFNASIIVLGLLVVAGAYLFHRAERQRLVTVPLLLTGIGAMGVGIFPETTGDPHGISALIAFIFGNLVAILAYRVERAPLRFISPILGILGLAALALGLSGNDLGLGFGGMERMIVYPVLLWTVAFGGSLMTVPSAPAAPQPTTQERA